MCCSVLSCRCRNIITLTYFFFKLETHFANFLVAVWNQERMVNLSHLIWSPLIGTDLGYAWNSRIFIIVIIIVCIHTCDAYAYVTEIEGLKRKLTSKLGANSPALVPDWQVFFPLLMFCSASGFMMIKMLESFMDTSSVTNLGVIVKCIRDLFMLTASEISFSSIHFTKMLILLGSLYLRVLLISTFHLVLLVQEGCKFRNFLFSWCIYSSLWRLVNALLSGGGQTLKPSCTHIVHHI